MPQPTERAAKAKIARRVIEVLDFFNDVVREATVMEIARRYGRPQSSTSELLASLVELGLLDKDPFTRTYSLTPRAAMLGWSGQTGIVRDGRLVRVAEELVADTGLPVAIFATAGLNAQVVSLRTEPGANVDTHGLNGGMQVPLSTSAAGWLLLSTVPQPRRNGLVHRLNAEAGDERKFSVAEMTRRLEGCRERRWVAGPAACHSTARLIARLVPLESENDRPLVMSFVHAPDQPVDQRYLLERLELATLSLTDCHRNQASVIPFELPGLGATRQAESTTAKAYGPLNGVAA